MPAARAASGGDISGQKIGPSSPASFLWRPRGRRHHVRAISGVRPGGTLRLMSAIKAGTVLTLGRAQEDVQQKNRDLAVARAEAEFLCF